MFLSFIVLFMMYSVNLFSQTVDQLIKEGDKFAEETYEHSKALEKYTAADKLSPKNWEVYWRISRAHVDMAEHLPSATDEQKKTQLAGYQEAYDWADKAVKLAPDKSINYLRRAIANGRIALYKGVFSVIGIVNSVKNDLEKAIKLGNGGAEVQATAHYVLGRTHAKVCEKAYLVRVPLGLGWGDTDVAEEEFKKAIQIRPNFRMFYFDLAKFYIEEDEYDKAKAALAKVQGSPKQDEDDDKLLAESKDLLASIKNK